MRMKEYLQKMCYEIYLILEKFAISKIWKANHNGKTSWKANNPKLRYVKYSKSSSGRIIKAQNLPDCLSSGTCWINHDRTRYIRINTNKKLRIEWSFITADVVFHCAHSLRFWWIEPFFICACTFQLPHTWWIWYCNKFGSEHDYL